MLFSKGEPFSVQRPQLFQRNYRGKIMATFWKTWPNHWIGSCEILSGFWGGTQFVTTPFDLQFV